MYFIGYFCMPKSDAEFFYLLIDASYFHLPRLLQQLTATGIFAKVGMRFFRIPRSLFSRPGDVPNYFTNNISTVYSLIEPSGNHDFIRPQQFAPPTVSGRSSELFQDLLGLLEGGCTETIIKSDSHRRSLIKECRFYQFRNLEQRLLPVTLHTNRCRQVEEIILNLEDIDPMNITLEPIRMGYKTAFYSRPFVDDKQHPRELIFQISDDETVALIKSPPLIWEVSFYDETRLRVQKLLNLFSERFGCQKSIGQHGYVVDVIDAAIKLNNHPLDPLTVCTDDSLKEDEYSTSQLYSDSVKNEYQNDNKSYSATNTPSIDNNNSNNNGNTPHPNHNNNSIGSKVDSYTVLKKRKLGPQSPLQMTCSRSLWRIKVGANNKLMLQLVRADCYCGQRFLNMTREFL